MAEVQTRPHPTVNSWVGVVFSLGAPTVYALVLHPAFSRLAGGGLASRVAGLAVMWVLAAAVLIYVTRVPWWLMLLAVLTAAVT